MSSSNLKKNLKDFDVTGGQKSPFPVDFARGPYQCSAVCDREGNVCKRQSHAQLLFVDANYNSIVGGGSNLKQGI